VEREAMDAREQTTFAEFLLFGGTKSPAQDEALCLEGREADRHGFSF
jgi:hypothetical protein